MSKRAFIIFTRDGERLRVEAPTLRTALRNFDEKKSPVVAAVETGCLPLAPAADDRPFYLVALANPQFARPENVA